MDPAVPPDRPRPEPTDYILGPGGRSAPDTPGEHSATGEFKAPLNPNVTPTAGDRPPPPAGPGPERTAPILAPAGRPPPATPGEPSATGEFKAPLNPNVTLTAGDSPPRTPVQADESLRLSVPGYEILSELGRGGMGV